MTETSQRGRQRLLGRVVDHLMATGETNLSLRALAREIGSSHRMLTYHFGGPLGLLTAVVGEVERRQHVALGELGQEQQSGSAAELSWSFWERLSAPELAPVERLFFQLQARLLETGDLAAAAAMSGAGQDEVAELMVARGLDRDRARRVTRLGTAVYRGLLLDLLVTGDRSGVDDAVRTYIESVFTESDRTVSARAK